MKNKSKKKTNLNINQQLANNIPFVRIVEDGDLIETKAGEFTRVYVIKAPTNRVPMQLNKVFTHTAMETILKTASAFSFQFCIRNRKINQTDYLKNVMLPHISGAAYNNLIDLYDQTVAENSTIGHNNYETENYLVLTNCCKTAELAAEKFDEVEPKLIENFKTLYGFVLTRMNVTERLEVLHSIYHPEGNVPFAEGISLDDTGFSIRAMELMKLTAKDIIAPALYETSARDYLRIGGTYARALFINAMPQDVPDTVITDILSVSSNAILSVQYQPMNSNIGFAAAARAVKSNTVVKRVPVRETITDKRQKRTELRETRISDTEENRFQEQALKLFKSSAAQGNPVLLTTFSVVIFADSLDELDRDTKLLTISAQKYSVQLRIADLMQNEMFQSALPLNANTVNMKRSFSLAKMAQISPVSVQSQFEGQRTFHGLNGINDNLILLDRQSNLSGMIGGTVHSGKTFACKREIFNSYASTNDEVIVLTNIIAPYTHLVQELQGVIIPEFTPDFLDADKNFNLSEAKEKLIQAFLEAFLALGNDFYKKSARYIVGDIDQIQDNERLAIYAQIEAEAKKLSAYESIEQMKAFAQEHFTEFQMTLPAMKNYCVNEVFPKNRFRVVQFNSPRELVAQLAYIWNYAILEKKNNKSIWIYVDGADDLLRTTSSSDLLLTLLDHTETLHIPVTMVFNDLVHLVSQPDTSIELDYLLKKLNYFKFLKLGPIERRYLTEHLGISDMLIPYVSDVEPGDGIIITPSQSIPFTDRLEDKESKNAFYQLFH